MKTVDRLDQCCWQAGIKLKKKATRPAVSLGLCVALLAHFPRPTTSSASESSDTIWVSSACSSSSLSSSSSTATSCDPASRLGRALGGRLGRGRRDGQRGRFGCGHAGARREEPHGQVAVHEEPVGGALFVVAERARAHRRGGRHVAAARGLLLGECLLEFGVLVELRLEQVLHVDWGEKSIIGFVQGRQIQVHTTHLNSQLISSNSSN